MGKWSSETWNNFPQSLQPRLLEPVLIHTYQLTLESNHLQGIVLLGFFKVNYDHDAILLEPWSLWRCEYTVNSRMGAWTRSLRPEQTSLMEKGRIPLSPRHQNNLFCLCHWLTTQPKTSRWKMTRGTWNPNFSLSCCPSSAALSLLTEQAGRPLPELESAIMGRLNANGWK